jgi:hypothetical protein
MLRGRRDVRHHATSAMVGPLHSGFPPLAPVLLRKTRPANGLWTKPGNSQGILASLRCSCSLRTAGAHSGGVLVQPAKPKGRFTMAQRCRQFQLGATLAFARCAMHSAKRPCLAAKRKLSIILCLVHKT